MARSIVMLATWAALAACSQAPETATETPVATSPATETASEAEADAGISPERAAISASSGLPQPKNETALLDCQSMDDTDVHCGYQNPEDLVPLPDGSGLIVSEMGEFMLDTPGGLSTLDLATGKRGEIAIDWNGADEAWGSAGCEAPDIAAFSPHGIDLTTRPDGKHQLLVVNHGKREAVEFLELASHDGIWSLTWRGCALPPGDPFINDVAGLAYGGFLVTHMWDKSTPFERIAELYAKGEAMGWVWEWQADAGFTKLPGSDEVMPNGIAVNADNSKVFVNVYLGNRTIRIDRASGEVDGSFQVQQPDNITVDADGNLWVASHRHDPLGQTCAGVTQGPCLLPYEVVRADPDTLETEVVVSGDGAPMGYTTVALAIGERIYMGSAHGDRIASRVINR